MAMIDRDSLERDMVVRAAWLYHVAGKTQDAIAAILGTSRVKVARLLSAAKDEGIVHIEVDHRLSAMCEVEEELRSRFDLEFCYVTPPLPASEGNSQDAIDDLARRSVGLVAARTLRVLIGQTEQAECVIGLAWGRTISALADAFWTINAPQTRFVSLLGSLTRSAAANPFDVVQKLAFKTNGEAHYFPVPFIANSEDDRRVFLQQRIVLDVMKLAHRAKASFISLGDCTKDSFLFRHGYLSEDDLATLQAMGAVGDTLGLFFDKDGRFVDSPICRRTLAIDLAGLKSSKIVLLSAGTSKVNATYAILKAGFIRGLIIDGNSALRLKKKAAEG